MGYPEETARLQRFFKRGVEMMSLGRHQFYVNPLQWSEDTERLHVEVQTYGGVGRFDFGVRPTRYSFYGTPGTMGLDEIIAMEGEFGLRGQSTQSTRLQSLALLYPYVLSQTPQQARYVLVDRFKKEGSPEGGHLYHWYTIECYEPPPGALAPYVAIPDTAGLAIGLNPPGG